MALSHTRVFFGRKQRSGDRNLLPVNNVNPLRASNDGETFTATSTNTPPPPAPRSTNTAAVCFVRFTHPQNPQGQRGGSTASLRPLVSPITPARRRRIRESGDESGACWLQPFPLKSGGQRRKCAPASGGLKLRSRRKNPTAGASGGRPRLHLRGLRLRNLRGPGPPGDKLRSSSVTYVGEGGMKGKNR